MLSCLCLLTEKKISASKRFTLNWSKQHQATAISNGIKIKCVIRMQQIVHHTMILILEVELRKKPFQFSSKLELATDELDGSLLHSLLLEEEVFPVPNMSSFRFSKCYVRGCHWYNAILAYLFENSSCDLLWQRIDPFSPWCPWLFLPETREWRSYYH